MRSNLLLPANFSGRNLKKFKENQYRRRPKERFSKKEWREKDMRRNLFFSSRFWCGAGIKTSTNTIFTPATVIFIGYSISDTHSFSIIIEKSNISSMLGAQEQQEHCAAIIFIPKNSFGKNVVYNPQRNSLKVFQINASQRFIAAQLNKIII